MNSTNYRPRRSERQDTEASRTRNGDNETQDKAFRKMLYTYDRRIRPFLPPNREPFEYFAACAQAAIQIPAIYDCSALSIISGLIKVAQTGLTIGTTCFLLPMKRVATFVPHYKGMIELAYDSGHVASIHARCIRETEIFEPTFGDRPKIQHIPKWQDDDLAIVGAYAVARMVNSQENIIALLNVGEIEAIRKEFSHQWKNGPLPPWYAEKTAIKKLCTSALPMSRRMQLAMRYDSGGEVTPVRWSEVENMPTVVMPDGHTAPVSAPAVSGASQRAIAAPAPAHIPIKVTNGDLVSVEQRESMHARGALAQPSPYDPFDDRSDEGLSGIALPWDAGVADASTAF